MSMKVAMIIMSPPQGSQETVISTRTSCPSERSFNVDQEFQATFLRQILSSKAVYILIKEHLYLGLRIPRLKLQLRALSLWTP